MSNGSSMYAQSTIGDYVAENEPEESRETNTTACRIVTDGGWNSDANFGDNSEKPTNEDDGPDPNFDGEVKSTIDDGGDFRMGPDEAEDAPSLNVLFDPDHPDIEKYDLDREYLHPEEDVDWETAYDDIFGKEEPTTPAESERNGISDFVETDDDHDLLWRIGCIAEDWQNGQYEETEALHRIAETVCDHFHCVRPHEEAGGVRDALYVYKGDDEGIYSPRGEALIKSVLEDMLGKYLRNAKLSEILGHVNRMALKLDDTWFQPPAYEAVVENGVIDFRTGEIRDCTPDEFFTEASKIPIEYDENASCPEIRAFLESIVDGDDVETLVHIAAHALVNAYPTRKAFMLVGDGANGKSIYFRVLEALIEGELVDEDEQKDKVSNVELADIAADENAAADLYGKRLNIGSDISSQTLKDLNMFKKATGGDPIRARRLYENSFTFMNKATMLFGLNEVPQFEEDTHAVWSRWAMINFPNEFHPGDDDYIPEEELLAKLTTEEELKGFFALCVEHLKDALNDGEWWPNVDSASKQREKMKKAAEPFYAAAMACLTHDPDGKVKTEDARECLRAYARQEGLPMGTEFEESSDFGTALKTIREFDVERKQRRFNGDQKYAYTGVSLSARGLQVLQGERPGEKILSSIEGQVRDSDTESGDDGEDVDSRAEPGSDVSAVVTKAITHLSEENSSGATYRAIINYCRDEHDRPGDIIDAIDELEDDGAIEYEDGVYSVVTDQNEGSVTDAERRQVVIAIDNAMRHRYDSPSKSSVLGNLHGSDIGIERLDTVLKDLAEDGHVVLGESQGDKVSPIETAFELVNGSAE